MRWLEDRYGKFLVDAVSLLKEISLLRNHPGWLDMERIIKTVPSIEYVEGKSTAYLKRALMVAEWSNKWSTSGEKVYNTYENLVNRGLSMETRKKDLLEEWSRLNAERLAVTVERHVRSPDAGSQILIEADRKQDARIRDDLNSFGIDLIGLYQIKATSALAKRLYQ